MAALLKRPQKCILTGTPALSKLKNSSGIDKFGRAEIVGIATEFYKHLYAVNTNVEVEGWREKATNKDQVFPIFEEEVEKAIKGLKANKAPRPDGI